MAGTVGTVGGANAGERGRRRGVWRRGLAAVVVAGATGITLAITLLGLPSAAHAASKDVEAVERTQELLGYIPSDHRHYCARVDPETFADGNFGSPAAIVYCDDPAEGVNNVVYVQYDDPAEAPARYAMAVPVGLPENDGSSSSCPGQGTWHFADAEDQTAGSDACSIGPGPDGSQIATMAWTSDAQNILALALNYDGDGAKLKQWWNDSAGPLSEPETDDELADLSRATRKAVSTRLADRTPPVVKTCDIEGADISDYNPDQPEWAWLPWLDGHVICTTPGKGRVDLYQLAPDNAADFAGDARAYLTDDDYPGTKHPAVCDEAHALVRHGDEVGNVACWYYHDTLWAVWYDSETGVVGEAAIPGKSPSELLAYLKRTKLT